MSRQWPILSWSYEPLSLNTGGGSDDTRYRQPIHAGDIGECQILECQPAQRLGTHLRLVAEPPSTITDWRAGSLISINKPRTARSRAPDARLHLYLCTPPRKRRARCQIGVESITHARCICVGRKGKVRPGIEPWTSPIHEGPSQFESSTQQIGRIQ